MPQGLPNREQIDRFLVDEIDTVPQLEALLLIWNRRPKTWYCSEISKSLYISQDLARDVIRHLEQHHLLVKLESQVDSYALRTDSQELEWMLAGVDDLYRRELVRISNLIHEKASRAVRDFASAFRFKKE